METYGMDVRPLLDDIASGDPARKEAAEDAIRSAGAYAVGSLVAELPGETKQLLVAVLPAAIGLYITLFLLILLASLSVNPEWDLPGRVYGLVASLGLAASVAAPFVVAASPIGKSRRRRMDAARAALNTIEDPRALRPLCSMLPVNTLWYAAPDPPAAALRRILLYVSQEHFAEMRPSEEAALYNLLDPALAKQDEELLIALLGAIGRTGRLKAIYAVQRLAGMLAATEAAGRVRDSADDCLVVLERLRENQRSQRTLLRPAEAPDSVSNLLRPAGATQGESAHLLRPTTPAEDR